MDDQGVEARAFFCFENLCDRDRIECVSSESIHCFCRQADHFASAQERYRLQPLAGGNDFCFHFGTRWASTASVCFFRNASNFLRASSSETARMLTASSAAFFAPEAPIASVPTGTLPGICAIERSASSPCSALD